MGTLRRLLMLAAILPGFCAYVVVSCSSSTQAKEEAQTQIPSADAGGDRLREGTTLELQGSFKPTGDRIMFYASADQRRFGTLENLNLERISRMVSDSVEPLEWSVSGTVTEFQGANYLLISRAVLKSKPQRRAGGPAQGEPGSGRR
jgi:hypothetical protein